jgi:hypothetical protein
MDETVPAFLPSWKKNENTEAWRYDMNDKFRVYRGEQ